MSQPKSSTKLIVFIILLVIPIFEKIVFDLNFIFGVIVNIASLTYIIIYLLKWDKRTTKEREDFISNTIQRVDSECKTKFSDRIGFGNGMKIYFDANNRKLLLIGASDYVVEDLSYIRQWQLVWNEKIVGNTIKFEDVDMVFHTTNFNRPIFRIRCQSKEAGESWSSRLSLLI